MTKKLDQAEMDVSTIDVGDSSSTSGTYVLGERQYGRQRLQKASVTICKKCGNNTFRSTLSPMVGRVKIADGQTKTENPLHSARCVFCSNRQLVHYDDIERESWEVTLDEPSLRRVTGTFQTCSACLEGQGGECHTPGCIFWLMTAPDLPLRDRLEDSGCKIQDTLDNGTK